MTKPKAFNLASIKAEAAGEPFVFDYGGESFSIPAVVDFRVAWAMKDDDYELGLKLLLGDEQWGRFMAVPEAFTADRLRGLVERYVAHMGVTAGESEASSSSSSSTAGQSKPTSNGSIERRSPT